MQHGNIVSEGDNASLVVPPENSMLNLPKPRRPRYLTLDSMRGIACLFIVIFHTTFYQLKQGSSPAVDSVSSLLLASTQWMWIGVPMFFVISGYCIAATSDSTRRRPTDHVQFFRRRFRRIYPPYYLAIAFQTAVLLVIDKVYHYEQPIPDFRLERLWELNGWQLLGNLTLTETWRWQFFGGPGKFLLGQSWTLCNEEQFYIVMGLILIFTPRSMFKASALVTAFCIAAYHIGVRFRLPFSGFFFNVGWLMFVPGVLVYYQVNYGTARRAWVSYGILTLGLGYAYGIGRPDLISALVFALMLLIINRWDARIATSLILRPFTFCGTICYSLYLTHVPITLWVSKCLFDYGVQGAFSTMGVTVPVSLACSVFVGWLFYLIVERKFINPPQTAEKLEPAKQLDIVSLDVSI